MNNWTREKLYNLGIFELRQVAREMGVRSPTLLKKDELVESVMEISNGTAEPYVKKNNKGRPPKEIVTITNFAELLIPKQKPGFDKLDIFEDCVKVSSGNKFMSGEKISKSGYVFVAENGYGFLYENLQDVANNVFISEHIIISNKLEMGDFVECECKEVSDDGKMAVCAINKINGIETKEYSKIDFDKFLAIKSNDCNHGSNLRNGEKLCVVGSKQNIEQLIVEKFNKHTGTKTLINLNALEEDYIKGDNVINFGVFDNVETKFNVLNILICNAQKCAMLSQNKAIFIVDLVQFINDICGAEFIEQKVNASVLTKVKKLITNARAYNNAGSFSLCFGANKCALNSNIIIPELCSVCNQTKMAD